VTEFPLPTNLVHSAARDRHDRRRQWVARLPATVATIATAWGLRLDDPFQPGGETSWTAPARDAADQDLVLKVAWTHAEAEHEAEGLLHWAGNGTVLLHASHLEDDTCALLLEHARPGAELGRSLPEPEQDVVVSGLLRRLWAAPPRGHAFRPLADMCDQWAAEQEATPPLSALDPGIVRAGIALFRSLPREAGRSVLLLTDLHAGNILSAQREPWLVIDPKPYVGDPTYDPLQHLLNCPERLFTDPWVLSDRVAHLSEVDADRLRLWLFARCVVESSWWPELAGLARRLAPR